MMVSPDAMYYFKTKVRIMANDIYVRLYIDHARIGCGFRNYLILSRGHRWARLFYIPTLTVVTIPVGVLALGVPIRHKPRRLIGRIRERQRERRRLGLAWSKPGTAAALDRLR